VFFGVGEKICLGLKGYILGFEGIYLGVEGIYLGVEGIYLGVEGGSIKSKISQKNFFV